MKRPSVALVIAFCIAQLVSIIVMYRNRTFTNIRAVTGGWIEIVCMRTLVLSSIEADVVRLAIHGLTNTFLQGYLWSRRSPKAVGSFVTRGLASKGFYVCPAPASRVSRVLKLS